MTEKIPDPPIKESSPHQHKHFLIFQSIPFRANIHNGTPKHYNFEGFNISELLVEKQKEPAKKGTTHNKPETKETYYLLRIAQEVKNDEEIKSGFNKFETLKTEIETIWHYIFGFPYNLGPKESSTLLKHEGWDDNYTKVSNCVSKEALPCLHILFKSEPVLNLKDWPLDRILHAVTNYRTTTEAHRFMMNLHSEALKISNINIKLTLLGKLLDLCEVLLPGTDRKNKMQGIPAFFRDRLALDDLFQIANRRSLTRHAAFKDGTLYAGMDEGEIEDFQSDVDTIARFIAAENLKLPPVFYEGWRFPANRAVNWRGKIGKEYSKNRDAKRNTKGIQPKESGH